MKKMIGMMALALSGVMMVPAQEIAPKLQQGTKELTLQGFVDFEAKDDYFAYFDIGYGTFIKDGLEVGLNLGVNASDASQNYNFGPFVEYNFDSASRFVPYVNGGARFVYSDVEFGSKGKVISDSGSALLLAAEAGVKYFLSNDIAISSGLAYEWATEDIFDSEDDLKDGNAILKFGMRFYL